MNPRYVQAKTSTIKITGLNVGDSYKNVINPYSWATGGPLFAPMKTVLGVTDFLGQKVILFLVNECIIPPIDLFFRSLGFKQFKQKDAGNRRLNP